MASTGKRSAQDLTGVDGDVVALEGNGWVIVRSSDGSETLRVQQRYLEKRPKDHGEVGRPTVLSNQHQIDHPLFQSILKGVPGFQ